MLTDYDNDEPRELNFDEDADGESVCWECYAPLDNDCVGQGCFCSNECQRAYYDE